MPMHEFYLTFPPRHTVPEGTYFLELFCRAVNTTILQSGNGSQNAVAATLLTDGKGHLMQTFELARGAASTLADFSARRDYGTSVHIKLQMSPSIPEEQITALLKEYLDLIKKDTIKNS